MKPQPGRLVFVPQTRLGLPGKVHTNTTAGSHGPRRPVPPRTPSPQLQPRCAAKSSCSRSPPVASPPNSRSARTWPSVLPAVAGRAAGERDHDAGSPPLPRPRPAPPGCPRHRQARRATVRPGFPPPRAPPSLPVEALTCSPSSSDLCRVLPSPTRRHQGLRKAAWKLVPTRWRCSLVSGSSVTASCPTGL